MKNKITKSIVLAHAKGGTGKSTLVSHIAASLSKDYTVTIGDLTIQHEVKEFLDIRNMDTTLPKIEYRVLTNEKELLSLVENNKGVVVIDTGGFSANLNRIAMGVVDIVISPSTYEMFEIKNLSVFANDIEKVRKEFEDVNFKSHVVLNNVNPSASADINSFNLMMTDPDYNYHLHYKYLNTPIRNRTSYRRAIEQGKGIIEYGKDKKANDEFKLFLKEILNGK